LAEVFLQARELSIINKKCHRTERH